MEQIELETAISELEDKVERLRVLYDQYFNGFEKIEPLIPRKDVERRIWVLRREQIRNTGLRFRFNQVVSRLNTFAMYWQRILRQIETGTFKRDLKRAEKRFGADALTGAAKRKLGKKNDTLADDQNDTNPPPSQASLPPDSLDDRFATVPGGFQPAAGTLAPPAAPAARPKSVAKLELDLDDDDDDDELFAGLDINAPAPPVRPSPPARPFGPSTAPPPVPTRQPPPPPSAARPLSSSAPLSSGLTSPPKAPPPSDPRPSGPPSVRTPAAAPPAPAQPVVRSGLAASNPFGGVRSGIAGNMSRPQPAAAPAPAPAPKPAPVAPAPAPAAKPAAAAGGLAADRVQDLYAKYVAAKKQCNEPTHAITTENVAKSLGESAAKLRQKHGKDVDFDVVVKDGKAIFKPILK